VNWRHPIEQVWAMTPRQVAAWLTVGAQRHARERAQLLADMALACQGQGDAISKAIRELGDA
jgi:hypothetical protein